MEKKLKLGPLGMNIELPGGQNMPVPVLHADIIGPLGNPESRKLAKELVERYNSYDEFISALKDAKKALENAPMVGEQYDQQHSDEQMRAIVEINAALGLEPDGAPKA